METIGRNPPQYAGLRMTADEYFDLPDDGQRYELVNGVIVMSPSPSFRHQDVIMEVANQLFNYLRDHPLGRVVQDIDIDLGPGADGEDLIYRPDVVYLRNESVAVITERIRGVVPDLIVEVVSPLYRRYDLETKKDDYERCGVLEYWAIDPDRREMHFWRLADGRYQSVAPTADTFTSQALPGFILKLPAVRMTFG